MRYVSTIVFCAFFMAPASAQTVPVEFITEPAGADVELISFEVKDGRPDKSTFETVGKCTTPCAHHMDTDEAYFIMIRKAGRLPMFLGSNKAADLEAISGHVIRLGPGPEDHKKAHAECKAEYDAQLSKDGSQTDETDAEPCYRVPPIMPPYAKRSGHCTYNFDIDAAGRPTNIRTLYCTEKIFDRAARMSLRQWRYHPKTVAGLSVPRLDVETKITFKLADRAGNLIPEPVRLDNE